jgi:single-stranded-DNA-specific exonuclease
VEFFLTEDPARASSLAEELKKNNVERRGIDQAITDECFARIDAEIDLEKTYFIVLSSRTWHPGVVGIVASRIVERYARPAMLICAENGNGRGSARSIQGLHVVEAIGACADLLEEYGGHEFAAGVSIREENIPEFAERLNAFALSRLRPEDLVRSIRTDAMIEQLDSIDWDLTNCLKQFEPHGPENGKPVFYARELRVAGEARIVGNNHLKFKVRGGRTVFDAIAFKMGDRLQQVAEPGRALTLAFTLEENEWMGEKTIQFNIRGIE